MNEELPLARRDLIASRLAEGQSVVAASLAVEFDVSEDAIRRDLRALAAQGLCRRVYGGALPMTAASVPMSVRIDEASERKRALGRTAAPLVQKGELLFLDSSSTNLALVAYLPEDFGLTVATNSIDIAAAALRRTDLRLVMIGGTVDPVVGGCVDAYALQTVARMNIDRSFLGACAISVTGGISVFDMADAAFKRAVLAASEHNAVLSTNEKLATRSPYRVASIKEIDCFVVEHDLPRAQRSALTKAGASVFAAAAPVAEPARNRESV